MITRMLGLSLFAALAVNASAEMGYRVSYDAPKDRLNVTLTLRAKGAETTLQLPSWSPGLYVREDYWKNLDDVTADDGKGASLSVEHPRGDTWAVANGTAKNVVIHYSRPVDRSGARLGMFSASGPAIHYTGPSTYLYVVDRKTEACTVSFDPGANVAIGLEKRGEAYFAPNYDELADATVTMGQFLTASYEEAGRPHELAFRGSMAQTLDREKVTRMARFLSKAETDFFGTAPYPKYVWHISAMLAGDNAGGVEHLNGTDIFVGNKPGRGALHGMAHEFFHLYNVKRIREAALGPFDYTQLPKAGALWWLEGVTDYYASIIPFRAGAWDEEALLGQASNNLEAVHGNTARFEVSPFESGDRTPESTSNSSGYRVNYYPTGWILGFMFDLELRARTKGRRSLDDVEKSLWALCKDRKPGFERDEIRRQLVRFGGEEMGGLYDAWVMKPGELPVEATLAKVGLLLQDGKIVRNPEATHDQLKLLEGWLKQRPLPKEYDWK